MNDDATSDMQNALYEADQFKQRAFLIAPSYSMTVAEPDYANLIVDGDTATLVWPEYTSDYYGGGYLERQSVSFPANLLLLSDDELAAWKAEKERADLAKWEDENRSYAARLRERAQMDRDLIIALSKGWIVTVNGKPQVG